MAKLRKTLPKHFDALMQAGFASGDYTDVYASAERCEPDARAGSAKLTALMMHGCTPDVARWFIARGVSIDATDSISRTALHHQARVLVNPTLPVAALLDLGATVQAQNITGETALHTAAAAHNLAAVAALVAAGADLDARNERDQSPLEYTIMLARNTEMPVLLRTVHALVEAGAQVNDTVKNQMTTSAKTFEFYRERFNPDLVDEHSNAMHALCTLLAIEPPPRRLLHDGATAIVATSERWQDQHAELWDQLVPASGPCATSQGEVIRIAGQVHDEVNRNGGGNWDADYQAMVAAFAHLVATGSPLSADQLFECEHVATQLPASADGARRLAELSTIWVAQNPDPIPLSAVVYDR